jgi:acyl-CoA reductase-like NAD-dependent aldehyde dehydrogenase
MAERIRVRNPRTGEHDYDIPITDDAAIADIEAELRRHQEKWQALGVEGRVAVLLEFRDALLRHTDAIVSALSVDTGRHALAAGEMMGLVAMIDRWCLLAPDLIRTEERPSTALPHITMRDQLQPYPLLGVISPWNFPLLLSFIDAIPALLAGCAVIVKPSEVTPRFAAAVVPAIESVPALAGVLRFIAGDGRSGAALIPHCDVIAFTGSVATGRKVAEACAHAFIPAFLELGGKDAVVVLEGSDIERATTAILRASVAATGQACQSLERIYVHESLHDAFVDRLVEKAENTPLSYPDPAQGIVGPLIFAKQAEIIAAHIEDAVSKGARIRTGGKVQQRDGGFWIEPTVMTDVDHSMQIMTEETFGPVMPVMAFATEAEAIQLANDSIYGLSGAVFGPDEAAAVRVAEQIDAGGISVNDAGLTTMIFEATKHSFKLSGLGGSRMGPSGMTRFFRHKALYLNRGDTLPIEAMAEGKA